MTSVCIVSPAWGRFDITRLVLEQRKRVCDELVSRGVDAGMLIAANDENLDIAGEYDAETIETPNQPLGQKCNTLLYAAVETGVDYLVWIGSDDWIHPSVFDPIIGQDEPPARVKIHTGRQLAIVDMPTGQMSRLRIGGRFGAVPWLMDARVLRNAVITRTRGLRVALINPKEKRGLDGALVKAIRLGRVNFEWSFSDPTEFRCVDFKTRTNITPFEGLARNVGDPVEPAWDALGQEFPADLVTKARDLSESLKGAPV